MSTVFGWTREEFFVSNLMALEAAFLQDNEKAKLKDMVTAAYSAAGD